MSGTRSFIVGSFAQCLLICLGAAHSQADDPKQRLLRFPQDRIMGMLHTRPAVPRPEADWMYAKDWVLLGEARGEIHVGLNAEVRLDIGSAAAQNLSGLDALGPDDIQFLNLRNTGLTDDGLEQIGRLTGIKWLDLRHTRITDAGTRHLKPLVSMIDIDLDAFGVDKEGFGVGNQTLRMMALGKWTQLENVRLRRTKVTDEGMAALALLKSLKQVAIAGTQVTDAGIEHLKRLPSLRSLTLGVYEEGCQLTDAGLVHVGEMTSLNHLDLSGTNVTNDGLKHLRALENLKTLSIDNTKVTNAGLTSLAPLQKLINLRAYLKVNISDEGAEHLGQLNSLTRLSSHLTLTANGLRVMSKLPLLENLDLEGKGITDEALVHVGEMKSLKELWLQGCPVTDRGLAQLSQLDNLEYLLIGRTQITADGLRHLKRLPRFSRLAITLERANDEQGSKITLSHVAEMKSLSWLEFRASGTVSKLAVLRNLDQLKHLQLNLDASQIDDDVARSIGEMSSLEMLVLQSSTISDNGLCHLSNLQNLRTATISGLFTPVGLKSLDCLKSLNYLQISSPFITQDDAQDLSKALPALQSIRVYETFQGRKDISKSEKDGIRREGTPEQRTNFSGLEDARPPALSLSDWTGTANGMPIKLAEFDDRVVLVHFFSVQDPNLALTMTKLKQMYSKYHDKGLEIIAVHSTGNTEKLVDFLADQKLPWPTAKDTSDMTATDWEVTSFPRYFLIGKSGTLRMAGVYFLDLEEAIKQLLKDE